MRLEWISPCCRGWGWERAFRRLSGGPTHPSKCSFGSIFSTSQTTNILWMAHTRSYISRRLGPTYSGMYVSQLYSGIDLSWESSCFYHLKRDLIINCYGLSGVCWQWPSKSCQVVTHFRKRIWMWSLEICQYRSANFAGTFTPRRFMNVTFNTGNYLVILSDS